MSKATAKPHTPEQRTTYWKARIFNQLKNLGREMNPRVSELFSMCEHIGVDRIKLEKIGSDIAASFTELQELVMERE